MLPRRVGKPGLGLYSFALWGQELHLFLLPSGPGQALPACRAPPTWPLGTAAPGGLWGLWPISELWPLCGLAVACLLCQPTLPAHQEFGLPWCQSAVLQDIPHPPQVLRAPPLPHSGAARVGYVWASFQSPRVRHVWASFPSDCLSLETGLCGLEGGGSLAAGSGQPRLPSQGVSGALLLIPLSLHLCSFLLIVMRVGPPERQEVGKTEAQWVGE